MFCWRFEIWWIIAASCAVVSRPLSCPVVDEETGKVACCNPPGSNQDCRVLIPKTSFGTLKTWHMETVNYANEVLEKFYSRNQISDSEFSSEFVSLDKNRRKQIEEENSEVYSLLKDNSSCCCEEIKQITVFGEGESYDKVKHEVYQEFPSRVQVAMQGICISNDCPEKETTFKCEQAVTYIPLYVVDKEYPDFLQEVGIEIEKGCSCREYCETEEAESGDLNLSSDLKKELFKRVAKYSFKNPSLVLSELRSENYTVSKVEDKESAINAVLKLVGGVVEDLQSTYGNAVHEVKSYDETKVKSLNDYQEKFHDAAMLIAIATKMLRMNTSYTDTEVTRYSGKNSTDTKSVDIKDYTENKTILYSKEETLDLMGRNNNPFGSQNTRGLENITNINKTDYVNNLEPRNEYTTISSLFVTDRSSFGTYTEHVSENTKIPEMKIEKNRSTNKPSKIEQSGQQDARKSTKPVLSTAVTFDYDSSSSGKKALTNDLMETNTLTYESLSNKYPYGQMSKAATGHGPATTSALDFANRFGENTVDESESFKAWDKNILKHNTFTAHEDTNTTTLETNEIEPKFTITRIDEVSNISSSEPFAEALEYATTKPYNKTKDPSYDLLKNGSSQTIIVLGELESTTLKTENLDKENKLGTEINTILSFTSSHLKTATDAAKVTLKDQQSMNRGVNYVLKKENEVRRSEFLTDLPLHTEVMDNEIYAIPNDIKENSLENSSLIKNESLEFYDGKNLSHSETLNPTVYEVSYTSPTPFELMTNKNGTQRGIVSAHFNTELAYTTPDVTNNVYSSLKFLTNFYYSNFSGDESIENTLPPSLNLIKNVTSNRPREVNFIENATYMSLISSESDKDAKSIEMTGRIYTTLTTNSLVENSNTTNKPRMSSEANDSSRNIKQNETTIPSFKSRQSMRTDPANGGTTSLGRLTTDSPTKKSLNEMKENSTTWSMHNVGQTFDTLLTTDSSVENSKTIEPGKSFETNSIKLKRNETTVPSSKSQQNMKTDSAYGGRTSLENLATDSQTDKSMFYTREMRDKTTALSMHYVDRRTLATLATDSSVENSNNIEPGKSFEANVSTKIKDEATVPSSKSQQSMKTDSAYGGTTSLGKLTTDSPTEKSLNEMKENSAAWSMHNVRQTFDTLTTDSSNENSKTIEPGKSSETKSIKLKRYETTVPSSKSRQNMETEYTYGGRTSLENLATDSQTDKSMFYTIEMKDKTTALSMHDVDRRTLATLTTDSSVENANATNGAGKSSEANKDIIKNETTVPSSISQQSMKADSIYGGRTDLQTDKPLVYTKEMRGRTTALSMHDADRRTSATLTTDSLVEHSKTINESSEANNSNINQNKTDVIHKSQQNLKTDSAYEDRTSLNNLATDSQTEESLFYTNEIKENSSALSMHEVDGRTFATLTPNSLVEDSRTINDSRKFSKANNSSTIIKQNETTVPSSKSQSLKTDPMYESRTSMEDLSTDAQIDKSLFYVNEMKENSTAWRMHDDDSEYNILESPTAVNNINATTYESVTEALIVNKSKKGTATKDESGTTVEYIYTPSISSSTIYEEHGSGSGYDETSLLDHTREETQRTLELEVTERNANMNSIPQIIQASYTYETKLENANEYTLSSELFTKKSGFSTISEQIWNTDVTVANTLENYNLESRENTRNELTGELTNSEITTDTPAYVTTTFNTQTTEPVEEKLREYVSTETNKFSDAMNDIKFTALTNKLIHTEAEREIATESFPERVTKQKLVYSSSETPPPKEDSLSPSTDKDWYSRSYVNESSRMNYSTEVTETVLMHKNNTYVKKGEVCSATLIEKCKSCCSNKCSKVMSGNNIRVKKQISTDKIEKIITLQSDTYKFVQSILMSLNNKDEIKYFLDKTGELLSYEHDILDKKLKLLSSDCSSTGNIGNEDLEEPPTERNLKNPFVKRSFSHISKMLIENYNMKFGYSGVGKSINLVDYVDLKPLTRSIVENLIRENVLNCESYKERDLSTLVEVIEGITEGTEHEVDQLLKALEEFFESPQISALMKVIPFYFSNNRIRHLKETSQERNFHEGKGPVELGLLKFSEDNNLCSKKDSMLTTYSHAVSFKNGEMNSDAENNLDNSFHIAATTFSPSTDGKQSVFNDFNEERENNLTSSSYITNTGVTGTQGLNTTGATQMKILRYYENGTEIYGESYNLNVSNISTRVNRILINNGTQSPIIMKSNTTTPSEENLNTGYELYTHPNSWTAEEINQTIDPEEEVPETSTNFQSTKEALIYQKYLSTEIEEPELSTRGGEITGTDGIQYDSKENYKSVENPGHSGSIRTFETSSTYKQTESTMYEEVMNATENSSKPIEIPDESLIESELINSLDHLKFTTESVTRNPSLILSPNKTVSTSKPNIINKTDHIKENVGTSTTIPNKVSDNKEEFRATIIPNEEERIQLEKPPSQFLPVNIDLNDVLKLFKNKELYNGLVKSG